MKRVDDNVVGVLFLLAVAVLCLVMLHGCAAPAPAAAQDKRQDGIETFWWYAPKLVLVDSIRRVACYAYPSDHAISCASYTPKP